MKLNNSSDFTFMVTTQNLFLSPFFFLASDGAHLVVSLGYIRGIYAE